MSALQEKAKKEWLNIVKKKRWKGYTKNEFEAFAMGFRRGLQDAKNIIDSKELAYKTMEKGYIQLSNQMEAQKQKLQDLRDRWKKQQPAMNTNQGQSCVELFIEQLDDLLKLEKYEVTVKQGTIEFRKKGWQPSECFEEKEKTQHG